MRCPITALQGTVVVKPWKAVVQRPHLVRDKDGKEGLIALPGGSDEEQPSWEVAALPAVWEVRPDGREIEPPVKLGDRIVIDGRLHGGFFDGIFFGVAKAYQVVAILDPAVPIKNTDTSINFTVS